jgi:hypothetical protein
MTFRIAVSRSRLIAVRLWYHLKREIPPYIQGDAWISHYGKKQKSNPHQSTTDVECFNNAFIFCRIRCSTYFVPKPILSNSFEKKASFIERLFGVVHGSWIMDSCMGHGSWIHAWVMDHGFMHGSCLGFNIIVVPVQSVDQIREYWYWFLLLGFWSDP